MIGWFSRAWSSLGRLVRDEARFVFPPGKPEFIDRLRRFEAERSRPPKGADTFGRE
jgi:hypothetical protein